MIIVTEKALFPEAGNLVNVTIYLSDRRYVKESAGLRAEILGDRSIA